MELSAMRGEVCYSEMSEKGREMRDERTSRA